MKKLTSHEVIKHLKKSNGCYIIKYFEDATCFDDDGNPCGNLSERLFKNLLNKNIIRFAGRCDIFYPDSYYVISDVN